MHSHLLLLALSVLGARAQFVDPFAGLSTLTSVSPAQSSAFNSDLESYLQVLSTGSGVQEIAAILATATANSLNAQQLASISRDIVNNPGNAGQDYSLIFGPQTWIPAAISFVTSVENGVASIVSKDFGGIPGTGTGASPTPASNAGTVTTSTSSTTATNTASSGTAAGSGSVPSPASVAGTGASAASGTASVSPSKSTGAAAAMITGGRQAFLGAAAAAAGAAGIAMLA